MRKSGIIFNKQVAAAVRCQGANELTAARYYLDGTDVI